MIPFLRMIVNWSVPSSFDNGVFSNSTFWMMVNWEYIFWKSIVGETELSEITEELYRWRETTHSFFAFSVAISLWFDVTSFVESSFVDDPSCSLIFCVSISWHSLASLWSLHIYTFRNMTYLCKIAYARRSLERGFLPHRCCIYSRDSTTTNELAWILTIYSVASS